MILVGRPVRARSRSRVVQAPLAQAIVIDYVELPDREVVVIAESRVSVGMIVSRLHYRPSYQKPEFLDYSTVG